MFQPRFPSFPSSSNPLRRIQLKEGEDADIEVSWEDQSNINEFSKLNTKLDDLQDRIKERVRERDYLEDLEQELEMVLDEEELVR